MTSPAELMRQLHDVADALLAVDLGGLDSAELHTLVVGLEAERSRLAVASADVLHRWERRGSWRADGSLRASRALSRDTDRCPRSAQHELRRARRLQRLVATRESVLAGRLSMDHVDLFLQFATAARFELFLEHETEIVRQCEGLSLFDDARRLLQYWAMAADELLGRGPSSPLPSSLYGSRSQTTGEWLLHGSLTPVDAEIVESELHRLMRELKATDRAKGVVRPAGQLRAAALVQMAARSINATGATARPLFQVIVGDETARHLCELASGHVVSPAGLAQHVDAAVMEAFLFDGPLVVIAKSNQRTFTGALRRAIQVRDRRCQHTSVCDVPAAYGDVDHRTPAARGGPTSQFNGRCACTAHNRVPELRDDPHELPERRVDVLEAARCRARWTVLHGDWPPGTWDDE